MEVGEWSTLSKAFWFSKNEYMDRSELCWIVKAFVFVLFIPGITGWGPEGHYATCKIAEGYFTEDALSMVKELLPASAKGDLASLCSWPDEIRRMPNYRWSGALHFADTPDFLCNYDYARDCHDPQGIKGRCVTGAIYNYTMQLQTNYENRTSILKYNLTEALIFLSHFMGDVHQPLHMGFLGDLGGNTIAVQWYERKTNLHRVWDDMIIESALTTFHNSSLTQLIQSIQNKIAGKWANDASTWGDCELDRAACPNPYASESISLACQYAYTNATAGTTLQDSYFLTRLPIVEKRLAQGGIRLAATLNRIAASHLKVAEA